MSFEPIIFTYTPPPTVPPQTPSSTPVLNTAAVSTNTTTTPTTPPLATAAITALNNLVDTSQYLQGLILNKYSNVGVSIDPAIDPTTAAALAAVYNGITPPIVTTAMYSNLIACQLALQSINQVLGNNSMAQADPYMASNVAQVLNAVSSSLLTQGSSDQVLINSLTLLQSNAVLFSNLASNLSVYQNGTDLSSSVAANVSALTSDTTSLYASYNSLLSGTNVINADINNVLTSYAGQTVKDVAAITSALTLLYNTTMKQVTSGVFNGLTALVDTRLMSDVSVSYFAADQLQQRLLTPLKNIVGPIGNLINSTSSALNSLENPNNLTKTNVAVATSPSIPGFSNTNPSSASVMKGLTTGSPVSQTPPSLNSISAGNQMLGQSIVASMSLISSEFTQAESGFIALQKRLTYGTSVVLQAASIMQAIESLVTIGNNTIASPISMPVSTAATSTSTSVSASSNSTNSIQVTGAPTTIPTSAIPPNVQTVLTTGAKNNLTGVTNA